MLDGLIASPQQREELAQAGIARAKAFDWQHVAAEVMRVYETVQDGTKVRVKA